MFLRGKEGGREGGKEGGREGWEGEGGREGERSKGFDEVTLIMNSKCVDFPIE